MPDSIPIIASARQYVELLARLQMSNARREGLNVRTPAQMVLEDGQDFEPVFAPIQRGPIKQCFENAYRLASLRRGFRYVEGWATSIIPVEHAWCVDREDRIAEVTWKEPGSSYFGVAVTVRTLNRVRLATGASSVFNQWWNWGDIVPILDGRHATTTEEKV